MFVVNGDALGLVHRLYLVNDEGLEGFLAPDAQDVMGVQRPGGKRIPGVYLVPVPYHQV